MRRPDEQSADAVPPATPRGALVLGLSFVGLLIVTTTALRVRILSMPASVQFGLLQVLPREYWIGIVAMGGAVALSMARRSGPLVGATGGLLFAVLAATPGMFQPLPQFWDGYNHLADGQSIGLAGHLSPDPSRYSTNWPGLFLFAWAIGSVGAIPPVTELLIFPALSGGLTFLALFTFLRSRVSFQVAAYGSVLGSLLNAWAQYHLSPQGIGLALALLVLATAWRPDIPGRIVNAVLFVGLVATHPTSTILLLAIFAVDGFLSYVGSFRLRPVASVGGAPRAYPYSPAMTYVVLFLAWLFFESVGSAETAREAVLSRMGDILTVPEETFEVAAKSTTENVYVWPPLVRLASLALYGLLGLVMLVALGRRHESRRLAQFILAFLVGPGIIGLSDILAFHGLFVDRVLMMVALVIPAVCLAGFATITARRSARRGVIGVLLVASLAAASTATYQSAFYFVSEPSAATADFLQRVGPDAFVVDGRYPVPVWIPADRRTSHDQGPFYALYPQPFDSFQGGSPTYAVFDPTAELWYRQWVGKEVYQFYAGYRTNHTRIYANGYAEVYWLG